MPSIQPITKDDISAVAEIAHWAKLSLTVNRLMWNDWPDEIVQKKRTTGAVRDSVQDPTTKRLKAVDDASGEVIGFIVLTPRRLIPKEVPEPKETPPTDTSKPTPGTSNEEPNLNAAVFSMIIDTITKIGKHTPKTGYIEIPSFAVKPNFRNKGIGTQLMRAAFEFAKSEGLPLSVTSEPAATRFFQNLGMQETTHAEMDLSLHAPPHSGYGVFRLTGMIWSPA